jgi:sugar/nucleoside kinase (ribokinase family)
VSAASSITVVGSVAFDTLETPAGRADDELGGAATHFAVAASFFAPVSLVAPVGDDFPPAARDYLLSRGIDCSGLETRPGKTFRWHGRYHEDMNKRDTLHLDLGVFAGFTPSIGDAAKRAPYVFLGTIDPALQANVLEQVGRPRLVGLDTMTHWIAEARKPLEALLSRVDLLLINDEEARQLAEESNLVKAARRILALGAKRVLVKRGEYGAILFSPDSVFAVPAFPLEVVFDPTGAGDTFAGGLMGWLAASGADDEAALRRGIVYGTVLASFVVEDFGGRRMRSLTREHIEQRYRQFVALTQF